MTKQKLEMFRGDDQEFTFIVKKDGVVVDITGWTFWMTAKENADDADVDAAFQVTNEDFTIVDADAGSAKVVVKAAKTSSLVISTDTNYYFDVQGKETGTAIHTIAYGTIKVRVDMTRAAA